MATITYFLETGRENAKRGKDLCRILRISHRDLMAAIEKERREGQPICASTGRNPGYFLAANKEEMKAYCDSLLRRGGELFKTRKACIKTIDKLPGNIPGDLDGVEGEQMDFFKDGGEWF